MKKLPWGIIAGICAIIVFFTITGTIAAFIVLNGIAAQTNESATLFDEWWQTALFVADIVFSLGLIGSCGMYVLKIKGDRGERNENETV